MTRACRLIVVVALALAGLIAPATASAHAVLEGSSPVNDILLRTAPTEITLTFSERVEPVGSIQLFDGAAVELPMSDPERVSDDVTRSRIGGTLTPGTYTVVWRVLSADGHVVNGAFVFHFKKRGANPEGIIGTVGSGRPPAWLRTLSSMARWWNLVTLILLVGGIAALLTYLSRRAGPGEARLWYLVSALGFTLSIAAAITVVLQGMEVRGATVGGSEAGGLIGDVIATQFGKVRLAQLLIAEVIAIVAVWGASSHRGAPTVATLGLSALALTVTPGLSGHALAVGPTGVLVDAVHVLAVSLWIGGLVFVALALALAGSERGTVAREVLPRFSRMAVAAAGLVILSGALSAIFELGGLGHLFDSTYGALLLVKIGLAAGLIVLGGLNRRLIPAVAGPRNADATGRIGRNIVVELGIVAAVMAVTTILVAEPPTRAVGSSSGPVEVTATAGASDLRLVIDPARVGPNTVHVYVSRESRSFDPDEVRVAFTNRDAGLGPIDAPAVRNEPGHYIAQSVPLSASGDWEIRVRLREGEFDSTEATVRVVIRRAPITT